jgi:hypothetical protein
VRHTLTMSPFASLLARSLRVFASNVSVSDDLLLTYVRRKVTASVVKERLH